MKFKVGDVVIYKYAEFLYELTLIGWCAGDTWKAKRIVLSTNQVKEDDGTRYSEIHMTLKDVYNSPLRLALAENDL